MTEASIEIYLSELRAQCLMTYVGTQQLELALQNGLQNMQAGFGTAPVFANCHSILTHASNISRLLWPIPGKRNDPHRESRAERGAKLRELLGVGDDHPLRNRALRDHLEHFDERLDDWDRTSEHGNYLQDNVARWGAIPGLAEGDYMRWYDPTTHEVRFRGEAWSIVDLVESVRRLLATIERVSEERQQPRTAR
ncbi:hypothetical protein [Cupriavidus respiraculi]|nr:hypothetical protein [Cupriavidus respiraculi]